MALSIIVIGAGASGLMAARKLSASGYSVTVLEAAAEPGGRILGLPAGNEGFSCFTEGGAEFIHGELPLSLQLAKEAGIRLHPVHGNMIRLTRGKNIKSSGDHSFMDNNWDLLMKKMEEMEQDMPIAEFMAEHFSDDRYAGLRESVRRFAEGYDLADISRVSTKSLHQEWAREGDDEEYRPDGGYRTLIDFLVAECRRQGAVFHFSVPVTTIDWQTGKVQVTVANGATFMADQILVTASLGILQANPALISFIPAIPRQLEAAGQLGYGSVIKILLEFTEAFWTNEKKNDQTLFIISEEPVPTWWTQPDKDSCVLTGWLAGGAMRAFQKLNKEQRVDTCIRVLAAIFALGQQQLQETLKAVNILDWAGAPHIRGGYSYDTVDAAAARRILMEPVEGTLWFAGEALYEGIAPGTVEAAFTSGQETAEKIIARS